MDDQQNNAEEQPTQPGGDPAGPEEQPTEQQPAPRRVTRPRDDRVIAGVCSGLGRYFGVDPVLFRVAAVALIFFGGAGILLYLAAMLFVPNEGDDPPASRTRRDRALAVLGVVLLVAAAAVVFSHGPFHAGWAFGPLVFFAIVGLVVWWLVSGERPRGSGRDVARSIARGLSLVAACVALAVAGAWIAGAGSGTAAGVAVIVAGAALAGAALEGHGRWLILPALSLALPVAFVSAANIDLHGGAGDKSYTPSAAAQVRDSYSLGAGRLVVDLRHASLPPGDHPLKLRVGVGEAVLLVPRNVCVATKAKVGIGVVDSFNRSNGGVDVDWSDQPVAATGDPRLVLDANVGLGRVLVGHNYDANGRYDRFGAKPIDQLNTGCEVANATP